MAAHTDQFEQVEGQWEELIRQADKFAGRRVRVTILCDAADAAPSLQNKISRWLAEGDALVFAPAPAPKSSDFGDGTVGSIDAPATRDKSETKIVSHGVR